MVPLVVNQSLNRDHFAAQVMIP